MKNLEELFLELWPQINEQVPATDQVDPGKRRVPERVVTREHAQLAHRPADPILVIALYKKLAQPLGRNVRRNTFRIPSEPGLLDRFLVDVGGENLKPSFG